MCLMCSRLFSYFLVDNLSSCLVILLSVSQYTRRSGDNAIYKGSDDRRGSWFGSRSSRNHYGSVSKDCSKFPVDNLTGSLLESFKSSDTVMSGDKVLLEVGQVEIRC